MAEKDKEEASTPAVTPPEGKTTVDDKMRFGPLRLSYQSARDIATSIVAAVAERTRDRVVVVADTAALSDFANMQAALLTLESLERDYQTAADLARSIDGAGEDRGRGEESFDIVAAPVSSVITAALGALSLFREDVEYRGTETTVDRLAFDLEVAAQLRTAGARKVFVPDYMIIPLADPAKGSLRDWLKRIDAAKSAAWAAAAPLVAKLSDAEADLDAATRKGDKEEIERLRKRVAELRRELEPLVGPLTRADERMAELQTQWGRIESGQELAVLSRMLRAEAIHKLAPVYLHCDVVGSGGHHRVSRSLLRFIFTGDGLSFTGGAIARWALLNSDGSIELGGIAPAERTVERGWWLLPRHT
jgi:hypothetical protein